jgi:hypothetical protein
MWVWLGALAVVPGEVPLVHPATIWNGPAITYNQPTPDPAQASNQDRITPDAWLTRAASKGLFNAYAETNASAFSPLNTEWAFGALTNYASLPYTNWLTWLNGQSPVVLIGQPVVLHLISDDIYLSLTFTNWAAGGKGGFAYQRTTPAPPAANLSGARINGGQFSFGYTAIAGLTYVVQSSSNLVNWASLATNTASSDFVTFSEPISAIANRYYRVSWLPNP